MNALSVKEGRLRALFEAGLAVSSELSLDALLNRLVEAAAELTGARYAALGVIDASGSELERFLTYGIDDDTRAEIGSLPRGRGILGVLISETRALRLHNLAEDPRSVGFPPGHPPMRSFLGVPIMLRGVAYGNLYLTEKQDGENFTEEDEELLTLLAGQAAVAIENARLYEAATRWSHQLQSLQEVGNALATETDLDRLLDLMVRRLRELLSARVVALALPSGQDELRFAAAAGESAEELLGETIPRADSKSGRVLARRRSERIDSVLDDPEVHQDVSRRLAARTGMWVPLIARDRVIGVLEIHDKEGPDARFTHDDLRLAETFAARAAVAVELSQQMARDAVRRVIEAQEVERQRIARELHDETGQALTSILLGLKPLEESADGPTRAALAELREHVVNALQDVRRLAVRLRPAVLDDFGLIPALERLTDSFADQDIRVDFHSALGEMRLPGEVETTLYRVVQESLTNVVKHANAHNVSVSVARRDSRVAAVVEDDGDGFDQRAVRDGGIGLLGMRERLALLDGKLEIESRPGTGTTVVAEVPLA